MVWLPAMTSLPRLASLGLVLMGALAALPPAHASEYPSMGPDVYDVHADGKAQVAAAVARATAEHKRVLLVFGANWCIWCHRLHATLENDPDVSKALRRDFVLVDVDVNTRNGVDRNADVNTRYGNPTAHGIPVLVVLDSSGKQLTTKDSGELEEGAGHSPAKILAFLSSWAPPAQ
jgi:thiol:disulfide interchange protein